MLITANLSYKMPNISEKDRINVIEKNIIHFTTFSVHSKIIFVYTGAHREDHCSRDLNSGLTNLSLYDEWDMLRLQINRVKLLCIDSILLMSFFKRGDQIWVLYSSLGRSYTLNSLKKF